MPFTKAGNAVMKSMIAQYGPEKGPAVFYASINKGIAGSSKWHRVKKHQREDTTTTGIARYVPSDTWADYKKKRKNWMQMGMSTFPREGGSSIACRRVYEGGPGSGRYPRNSGEHAELVRKLNLIVQRAVAAKTGKASIAYRNAAMAVRARLAGRKPTSFGTVRDLYKMDFNYRPQLASLDTWFDYKNTIHEVGSASK